MKSIGRAVGRVCRIKLIGCRIRIVDLNICLIFFSTEQLGGGAVLIGWYW